MPGVGTTCASRLCVPVHAVMAQVRVATCRTDPPPKLPVRGPHERYPRSAYRLSSAEQVSGFLQDAPAASDLTLALFDWIRPGIKLIRDENIVELSHASCPCAVQYHERSGRHVAKTPVQVYPRRPSCIGAPISYCTTGMPLRSTMLIGCTSGDTSLATRRKNFEL